MSSLDHNELKGNTAYCIKGGNEGCPLSYIDKMYTEEWRFLWYTSTHLDQWIKTWDIMKWTIFKEGKSFSAHSHIIYILYIYDVYILNLIGIFLTDVVILHWLPESQPIHLKAVMITFILSYYILALKQLETVRPILLTWFDCSPSMDK